VAGTKGSGPAIGPRWVEQDCWWVRRRRIRPRASSDSTCRSRP